MSPCAACAAGEDYDEAKRLKFEIERLKQVRSLVPVWMGGCDEREDVLAPAQLKKGCTRKGVLYKWTASDSSSKSSA